MAIVTTQVLTTNTTVYLSNKESAITIISFCNYSANDETITIHIVPNGSSPGVGNIFVKDITIVPGDTFIVYQGGEKLILSDGDLVNVIASTDNTITAIASYVTV